MQLPNFLPMRSAADSYQHRLARLDDLPAMRALMDRAIGVLQCAFLDPAQIAASRAIMGLDTQLVADGTYFVVEQEGRLVGCGGWSRRATLYGSDATMGRNPALLDPVRDPARCGRCTPIRRKHAAASGGSSSACARAPPARKDFGASS